MRKNISVNLKAKVAIEACHVGNYWVFLYQIFPMNLKSNHK